MLFLWFLDVSTILIFLVVFLMGYWLLGTHYENLPPGPRPLPLVGNIMEIPKFRKIGMKNYLKSLAEKYGPVTRLWLGMKPIVIIQSLDLVREALVDKKDVFSCRPQFIVAVDNVKGAGKGIIFANETSKEIRRHTLISMRDFGLGKKSLEERTKEEAGYLITELCKQQGKPYDIKRLLANAVGNIICHLALGTRFDYNDPVFSKQLGFLQDAASSKQFIMNPTLFIPYLKWVALGQNVKPLLKSILDFLMARVQEHRNSYDPEHIRDLMDLFIKHQKEKGNQDASIFDDENLKASIIDLFAAGTETTSSALSWAILYLLKHPEIQTKCQGEIDREVGRSRAPGLSDRPHLPYITAVLQEVQRIAAIVPLALPHCTSADTTLGQYSIPKGTGVFVNLHAVHHDPAHWDDPYAFKPERWLNDEGKLIKNDAYIPFGVGPRTCLGEPLANTELFLFFSRMLQDLTFQKETPDAEISFEGVMGATRMPEPYKVRAIER